MDGRHWQSLAAIGRHWTLLVNPSAVFICLTQRYPNPSPKLTLKIRDVPTSIKGTQGANNHPWH